MDPLEEMLGQKRRPPLCLRAFLAEYRATLDVAKMQPPVSEQDIEGRMRLSNQQGRFNAIRDRCSLEKLARFDDPIILPFVPGVTSSNFRNGSEGPSAPLRLKTVNKLVEAKRCSKLNPFKRSQEVFKLAPLPPCGLQEQRCAFYDDLIVTVRVYRQTRATHIGRTLEKPVFANEFECLGSNLLTEFRDKITCVCNKKTFYDISENPQAVQPLPETDPGYFFITDTFYNDKRHPDNADYSERIRQWARTALGLEKVKFKVAPMENTRFIDLTVSLGFPQLYQHHGNCEHVFTISQVELFTPAANCRARTQFPRLCSFGLYNTRQCNLCGVHHYAFIVVDSNHHVHDPAYVCRRCFYSFHYVDGQKVGSFKAYRVNDVSELSNDTNPTSCQSVESSIDSDHEL